MIKRWVTTVAFLGAVAAPFCQYDLPAQPPAAVPAWIPPPAPAQPTLWRFLGIPQGFQRIGDARLNRSGNFPGLERKPPLKPIAHPDNLLSNNPAIKKAAEIKMQEDLAKQKIKAIKYLAKLGCDKCYGGVKEAMMAALDDCTEQVRYEGAKALAEAAVQHCDVCSRQCCCDEELTKKLAAIVYEMDDKGCPLEPSERIRNMAKEALDACCPNVGPPPAEIIEQPPIEQPPIERPPELPPEVPPETPAELPPPPGRNGVAPRVNGDLPPATIPPMPTARPALPPDGSTQSFLRSRADRMAQTSRLKSAPAVRGAHKSNHTAQPSVQPPLVEVPVQSPRQQPAAAPQPAGARLVISDEGNGSAVGHSASAVVVGDSPASAVSTGSSRNALSIRSGEKSEHAASPKPNRMWPAKSNEAAPAGKTAVQQSAARASSGNVVRIRDSADDLQLASAEEPEIPTLKLRPVATESKETTISDLFAPPPATTQTKPVTTKLARPSQPAHTPAPAAKPAAAVKPNSASAKSRGRVSDIDVRGNVVRFTFKGDQTPATGSMVKVYHQFLLGEECVGALEVTGVKNGIATARPVGSFNLTKLSLDDQVAFQSAGTAAVATNGTLFAAP